MSEITQMRTVRAETAEGLINAVNSYTGGVVTRLEIFPPLQTQGERWVAVFVLVPQEEDE